MRNLGRGLLVGAILLDVVYWTLWFVSRDTIASEHTRAYYAFETAFPLADLWLGAACAMALWMMSRRRPSALLWLICAGAAGLYLGCMDLLYDVENAIFTSGAGGLIEGLIVLLTWVFSLTVLTGTWRHRGELLSADDSARAT